MEGQGTWAAQKHSEAGYGRPVDRGVWTAKTVKRPRQQPAHPQYANYWAPLTRKRHTMPHSAQSQHANYWAPRTRKQHQQEHRPQRPTESSDPTQHAKGRTGDRPGPRKGTTTRRNVTQGGGGGIRYLAIWNLRIFAKFCACSSAPCNTLFLHVRLFFLISEIPPEEDALTELFAAPDDDAANAPPTKKPKLNYLTNVRAKDLEQWQFYKELRILNPANLSSMSHDISLYSTLRLPLADPEFMGEWQKCFRIEGVAIANHGDLILG